ncbi:rab11 family-interacting protein 3 isoform X2 [Trichomycterus rosablanca]|uniref:rab11 family-interacting protein 3 isoform X2 n=1 Tax=Trichomycterus rosablanca TaxID=2290929 RepID=UPI002F353141
MGNLPEDTGNKETISIPNVAILDIPIFAAEDERSLAPTKLYMSENILENNTAQPNCHDLNKQKVSEDLSFGANNCEHALEHKTTPEETTSEHKISDDYQNTQTSTGSSDDAGPEVLFEQDEEREDKNTLQNLTYSSVSLPDSTFLSGTDCQVGNAVEQEVGGATSRLSQSADLRTEGVTDLPGQQTQLDLSQVADPEVNCLSPLSNESTSGVFQLEETCPPLMEEDIINIDPSNVEMALDLHVNSDIIRGESVGANVVPTATYRDEDSSALRAVFQALDQDGDGFVRIEEFMEFATAYGAEQVKDLTRFLDPGGMGVISFEDFHRGITAISNGGSDPDLYKLQLNSTEASGAAEEYDEQAEVSDSAYLGSESAYSECETFTDEDTGAMVHPELHEDVETDSGIENTLTESEDHNRFSLGSDLHGHAMVAVIGGAEEHYEDFGESNNSSDLLPTSQEEGRVAPEGEGDPEPHLQAGSPLHRPPVLLSPSFQTFLQSESLEFFCTHCHKQISRLEDISTRLHLLEMNSSSKRLSSKKAARHLLQSSGLDGMSNLSRDILDLADSDITDKVLMLERRVSELEKDSAESEEQHARLRQENLALVHRANALEEQLKEQELHADEDLNTLSRKHRDALNKLQRERELEIETLQARLQQLDEENGELRSCVPCLRANIERLEEEKRKLQDEMEDVTDRLNKETDSRRKMADKLSHERHTSQKEKESTQELIEDLRKQLELLQLFKLEMEARHGRSPAAGLQEYNTHMRENELEQEIRRLKQDNRSLKEQNDELNGQIINLSIQGAKSLFTESLSESLAAEINNVSRTELMEAIQKQEEINFRLQDYIDRIIVAIMESNPSILEVK